MALFKTKFEVKPNTTGFLFKENKFWMKLDSGIYKFWNRKKHLELFILPNTRKVMNISNQEVLTKDNIALRFSFYIIYRIVDGERFLMKFPLDKHINYVIGEAESLIWNITQIHLRSVISAYESEELNEKRNDLNELDIEKLKEKVVEYGFEIEDIKIKDLTFPKAIQELFSKHLEAKVRAKADLENARTAVATARTLKNAAELMRDNDNIKFMQVMETLTKIAEKGKHTFMIGEINQLTKNRI